MNKVKKFDVFISYSHAADGKFAPALQKGFERLICPWHRIKALNVFRDETDLSITPDLWHTIAQALEGSKYFILLASPRAAASKWVKKEIAFWLEHKKRETLLIALTEGELVWDDSKGNFDRGKSTALPENLFGEFEHEPLFADFRYVHDNDDLTLDNAMFKMRLAQVASPIHQRSLRDLIGEEMRQQRNIQRTRNAVISAIVTLLSVISLLGVVAMSQRNAAERRLRLSVANNAASQVQLLRQTNPTRALALAQEAYNLEPKNPSPSVVRALTDTFYGLLEEGQAIYHHEVQLSDWGQDIVFQHDGKAFFSVSNDGNVRRHTLDGTVTQTYPHDDWPQDIQVSPDGKYLMTNDSTIITIWSLESHEQISRYEYFAEMDPKFLPNGNGFYLVDDELVMVKFDGTRLPSTLVASGEGDFLEHAWLGSSGKALLIGNRIRDTNDNPDGFITDYVLWNENGEELAAWTPPGDLVSAVQASPDGKHFFLICNESDEVIVRIYDNKGNEKAVVTLLEPLNNTSAVRFLNNERLVGLGRAGRFQIWNLEGKELLNILASGRAAEAETEYSVNEVKLLPDDRILTAAEDGLATLWSMDGVPLQIFIGHERDVTDATISPDGSILVTSSGDATLKIWHLDQQPKIAQFRYSDGLGVGLEISPDGRWWIISSDRTVEIWDAKLRQLTKLPSHENIASVRMSPSGDRFVTAPFKDGAMLWSKTGEEIALLGKQGDEITSFEFIADGNRILIGTTSGWLRLYDNEGNHIRDLKGHSDRVNYLELHPNGKWIGSTSSDGNAILWDFDLNEQLRLEHESKVGILAFSPDGQWTFCEVEGQAPVLWTRDGAEKARFEEQSESLITAFFTPDSQYIVTADGQQIRKWNLDGERIDVLSQFESGAVEAWFSQDGSIIASRAYQPDVLLTDLEGNVLTRFLGHDNYALMVGFFPDGERILTLGLDGLGKIWYTPSGTIGHLYKLPERVSM